MKSQNPSSGENVVQNFEDWLFHFSRKLSAENDHLLLAQVQSCNHWWCYTFDVWRYTDLSSVENVDISTSWKVLFKLFLRRSSKHVSHEESVIGSGAESSNFDLVFRIPTGITINDDASVLVIDVVDGSFLDQVKFRFFNWNVDFTPINSLSSKLIFHDSSVLRFSSCF